MDLGQILSSGAQALQGAGILSQAQQTLGSYLPNLGTVNLGVSVQQLQNLAGQFTAAAATVPAAAVAPQQNAAAAPLNNPSNLGATDQQNGFFDKVGAAVGVSASAVRSAVLGLGVLLGLGIVWKLFSGGK